MRCSAHPTSMRTRRRNRTDRVRIHMIRVRSIRTSFLVTIPMTLHDFIVAIAIPVIGEIDGPLLISARRKRSKIVTCYDLLLKINNGCLLNEIRGSGMLVPPRVFGSHSSIRQDFMILMSVRVIIALNMSITSMSYSDIDGVTATATETKSRRCRIRTPIVNIENVGGDA